MSEPTVFLFKRDGQVKAYSDGWAGSMLYREIMFGPDALEKFGSSFNEVASEDFEYMDEGEGVAVDFDNRVFLWTGAIDEMDHPRVASVFEKLLAAAWPGFQVILAKNGINFHELIPIERSEDRDEDEFEERDEKVTDAGRLWELDSDDEDDEEEDSQVFDEDETRAWAVIVDKAGKQRHRNLNQISQDFLVPSTDLAKQLSSLKSIDVPREGIIIEGVVIDIGNKTLSLWGKDDLKAKLPKIQKGWRGWTVNWLADGYTEQCQLLGHNPDPMTDEEALAKFMPQILSNKRIDMQNILGAMGGGIKKTAVKAVGCLYMLICVPILIWGLISGNWTAALITMVATLIAFAIIFKVLEYRFKKKVGAVIPRKHQQEQPTTNVPQVAGPENVELREEHVAKLLDTVGLPPLHAIKDHYPDAEEYELLYQ